MGPFCCCCFPALSLPCPCFVTCGERWSASSRVWTFFHSFPPSRFWERARWGHDPFPEGRAARHLDHPDSVCFWARHPWLFLPISTLNSVSSIRAHISFLLRRERGKQGHHHRSKQPTPHGKWPKPPRAQWVAPSSRDSPSVPRATWQPPLLRHRPGNSICGTKRRCLAAPSLQNGTRLQRKFFVSSGPFLVCGMRCPSVLSAFLRWIPFSCKADTNVASRGSWLPPKRDKPSATTSSLLLRGGVREVQVQVTKENVRGNPCSTFSTDLRDSVLHCKSPTARDPDCRTRCSVMAKRVKQAATRTTADRKGLWQAETAQEALGKVRNPFWRHGGPAMLLTGRKLADHSENGLAPVRWNSNMATHFLTKMLMAALDATFCHPCCGSVGSLSVAPGCLVGPPLTVPSKRAPPSRPSGVPRRCEPRTPSILATSG